MASADPDALLDFRTLLQNLAAVHEQQQSCIQALTEENEALRARLNGAQPEPAACAQPSAAQEGPRAVAHLAEAPSGGQGGGVSCMACGMQTLPAGAGSSAGPGAQDELVVTRGEAVASEDSIGDMPMLADSLGSGMSTLAVPLEDLTREESRQSVCSAATTNSTTAALERVASARRRSITSVRSNRELNPEIDEGEEVPRLWPVWSEQCSPHVRRGFSRAFMTPPTIIQGTTGQMMRVAETRSCLARCIMKPNSPRRLVWDLFSCFMVCYDVVTIPLMVFEPEDSMLVLIMDVATTAFWSLDLPCSFLTGYYSEGSVEMRPRAIARQYLASWFVFDVCINIIDWAFLYASSLGRQSTAVGFLRVGKTGRITRILRAIRLLRFVKLQRVLHEVLELINSAYVRASFNIFITVIIIITVNHYFACGWYLIGKTAWDSGQTNWIVESDIAGADQLYSYMTSLHWSLTQFTPASMEVRPFNLTERIYSITVLLCAMACFSSFVGTISTGITQLRKLQSDKATTKVGLRRYFLENKVSIELGQHIWSFLKSNHFQHKKRTHTQEIEVLKFLPPPLKKKLRQELYAPYITRVPFFYHYTAITSEGLIEICYRAVSETAIACNDIVFSEGRVAEHIFFVASGILDYHHTSVVLRRQLTSGLWACEPVLWLQWMHCASLQARTPCELIQVESRAFRDIMGTYLNALPFVRSYAEHFRELIMTSDQCWNTDIWTNIKRLDGIAYMAWNEAANEDAPSWEDMRTATSDRHSNGVHNILSTLTTRSSNRSAPPSAHHSHGMYDFFTRRLQLVQLHRRSKSSASEEA